MISRGERKERHFSGILVMLLGRFEVLEPAKGLCSGHAGQLGSLIGAGAEVQEWIHAKTEGISGFLPAQACRMEQ
jgi:hypothetical protein